MAFIGNSVQTQGFTPAVDYFSGNGSTVTFTLSRPVAAAVQVEAVIDNVVQNPSTAYTVSGNAITFTSAPLSGSNNIYVRYTSLITTYNGISQSPSVIGDLTASGGYLSTGSFNNSFVDGTIVDYVTGNGRVTVGPSDGFTLYNGGTSARTSLLALNASGAMGVGTSPSYGTAGQVLTSQGSGAPPTWSALPYIASYLIVAGGGGGGSNRGGGGGAGGLLTGTVTLNAGTVYSVTVGAGGAGGSASLGGTGVNSVLSGNGITTQTALAGGGGAYISTITGVSGGSGGGGAYNGGSGGSGTSGQGFGGGSGSVASTVSAGGGGGAGAVGANGVGNVSGGNGGVGLASSISGTSTYYAGGGGGSSETVSGGAGGAGGGGTGATNGSTNAVSGTANTGGGGGGGYPNTGGNGGSGVVILSVPTSNYTGTTTGSPTVTTNGLNTVIKFTASGSYTA